MKTLLATSVLMTNLFFGGSQEKPAVQEKAMPSTAVSCPLQASHEAAAEEAHRKEVAERGDQEMRFSHDKTAHHFRLLVDGGAIEAEANDGKDTASREAIRSHFAHIVKMFAAGNFSVPMLIHAQTPPGTEAMARLRDRIEYKIEETERGGRIRIVTKDVEALRAVHDFLRFQIADHATGDSVEITMAR